MLSLIYNIVYSKKKIQLELISSEMLVGVAKHKHIEVWNFFLEIITKTRPYVHLITVQNRMMLQQHSANLT